MMEHSRSSWAHYPMHIKFSNRECPTNICWIKYKYWWDNDRDIIDWTSSQGHYWLEKLTGTLLIGQAHRDIIDWKSSQGHYWLDKLTGTFLIGQAHRDIFDWTSSQYTHRQVQYRGKLNADWSAHLFNWKRYSQSILLCIWFFFLYLQFCFALDITYHNVSNPIPDTSHTVI